MSPAAKPTTAALHTAALSAPGSPVMPRRPTKIAITIRPRQPGRCSGSRSQASTAQTRPPARRQMPKPVDAPTAASQLPENVFWRQLPLKSVIGSSCWFDEKNGLAIDHDATRPGVDVDAVGRVHRFAAMGLANGIDPGVSQKMSGRDNATGLAQTRPPGDAAVATALAQADRSKRADHAAMIAGQSLELQRLAPRQIARFVLGKNVPLRFEAEILDNSRNGEPGRDAQAGIGAIGAVLQQIGSADIRQVGRVG